MIKKILLFFVCSAASLFAQNLELSGNHLDEPLMEKLVDLFHIDNLVETGTYQGNTARTASRHFKDVYTIELSHKLFRKASKALKPFSNVHCYEGHSGDVVAAIAPKLKGKTLFWLDAHYSGGPTAKGNSNSAIRDEIAAIKKCGLKDAVILIDDIRGFQGKPEEAAFVGGFPTVKELKEMLLSLNPDYAFWILGDMAIAYPKTESIEVSPLVKACTLSRLFEKNDLDTTLVMAQEQLLKTGSSEASVIDALHQGYCVQGQETTNATHYFLWEGLASSGKGNYSQAIDCFQKAIGFGYDHWRVYWYLASAQYEAKEYAAAKESLEKVAQEAPEFKEAQELKAKADAQKSCLRNNL
jgi:tetratricopeptide (TPR) repeat protein